MLPREEVTTPLAQHLLLVLLPQRRIHLLLADRQLLLQLGQLSLVAAALIELLLARPGKCQRGFGLLCGQEVMGQGGQLLISPQLTSLLQAGIRVEQIHRQIRMIRCPLVLQAAEGVQPLCQRLLLALLCQLIQRQGIAPL